MAGELLFKKKFKCNSYSQNLTNMKSSNRICDDAFFFTKITILSARKLFLGEMEKNVVKLRMNTYPDLELAKKKAVLNLLDEDISIGQFVVVHL